MKIAIIDSGIDVSNKIFKNIKYEGYCIGTDCKVEKGDIIDRIGHGTAVASIIFKGTDDCEYVFYKALKSNNQSYTIDELIAILDHISCYGDEIKVVHISSGCSRCIHEDVERLKKVCDKLVSQNIIIVAAYDNEGGISYPAFFDNVIGVDWTLEISKTTEYIYLKNSPINILGIGTELRLPWLNNTYKYVSGSSFATPYVTVNIVKAIQEKRYSLSEIHEYLENNSKKVMEYQVCEDYRRPFKINKAIVFPVNKEMHSVLANSDLMNFDCVGIYDDKFSRNVGKKISEVLNYIDDDARKVQCYENINWNNDFDTVIIGHIRYLSKLYDTRIKEQLLEKCLKYKKNVYCFDEDEVSEDMQKRFKESGLKLFYPTFNLKNIAYNKRNKLYKFAVPSIAVLGTSSKQGKFSLQLELIRALKQEGYSVGHFSTEPTGYLLGSDITFPIGFESTINFEGEKIIDIANSLMHEIETKTPDIIIVGTQSHTIPNNEGNLGHYPISTMEILLATQPDAAILCVNYNDSTHYINKTIQFIESYYKTKVIALCISPIVKEHFFSIQGNQSILVSDADKEVKRSELECILKRKAFMIGKKEEANKILQEIISFFS